MKFKMDMWQTILIAALGANAALGFGYRVFRLTRGGPLGDVTGQAVLGLLLAAVAIGVALDESWARWTALAYGLLFALVVMPLWTLAVLIPMRPQRVDIGFTALYWAGLALIVVSAIAL